MRSVATVAALVAIYAIAVSTLGSGVAHASEVVLGAELEAATTTLPFSLPSHTRPFVFESPLVDIQWASPHIVYFLSADGIVYRSQDSGRQWEEQNSKMDLSGVKVHAIRISPVDKHYIFFVGSNGHHAMTTDMGNTYVGLTHPLTDVKLHPVLPEWILGLVPSIKCGRPAHDADPHEDSTSMENLRNNCYKQLYYSSDFGRSWRHLYDYVAQFDWARPLADKEAEAEKIRTAQTTFRRLPKQRHTSPVAEIKNRKLKSNTAIYATVQRNKAGDQIFGRWSKEYDFVLTKDLFETEPEVLVTYGNRFLFGKDDFLFVAAVDPMHEHLVQLMVSKQHSLEREFDVAVLPVDLAEHSYTILDSSEGMVFLHVNHNPVHLQSLTGHVYTSDSTGTQYSLSLPYQRRAANGRCDFVKIEALEGIFLANYIDVEKGHANDLAIHQEATSEMGLGDAHQSGGINHQTEAHIQTVITFNKGGEWVQLGLPVTTVTGNAYECHECSLHLNGVNERHGPFYSVASAPGIILATGNVGHSLSSAPHAQNTYLSRDGGLTWHEIALGSHIYEIADHGGLIVLVPDSAPTRILKYSWDSGKTWHEYVFSPQFLVQVQNVITEPQSKFLNVIVYGTLEDGRGVTTFVDFSQIHPRHCIGEDAPGTEQSDYELFVPSDQRPEGQCLMGHTSSYVRRKADRACYNTLNVALPTFRTNCACTAADFECDAGYVRASPHGPCVLDEESDVAERVTAADAHRMCKYQSYYRVTKGYRKIPGNTCTGGHQWEAILAPCPSRWLSVSHAPAIFLLVLMLIAFVAIFLFQFEAVDKYAQMAKERLSIIPGVASLIGALQSRPHSINGSYVRFAGEASQLVGPAKPGQGNDEGLIDDDDFNMEQSDSNKSDPLAGFADLQLDAPTQVQSQPQRPQVVPAPLLAPPPNNQ